MQFTLNQLQVFLKVVQTQSVTKAAEELSLSQPAVSIQLRNFQAQFDSPLTEVVGRRIFITEFGQEVAVAAESILSQVHALHFKNLGKSGQLTGKIKLSIVSTGKYVMPFFISQFMQQNPGVELIMDVTNKRSVIASLENNEVDFALVSVLPNLLSLEHLDLLPNRLYFVGKAGQQGMDKVKDDGDFKYLPLIFREKGSGTRDAMEDYFNRQAIKTMKKMELASNEAVKQAVLAGLGYSVLPLIGIRNELLNGELEIIPMPGMPIRTTWRLVWLKGKKLPPVAAAYLDHLLLEKANIVRDQFAWYAKY